MIGPILREFKNVNVRIVCLALTSAHRDLIVFNDYDNVVVKKISEYSSLFLQDLDRITYWGKFIIDSMKGAYIEDLDESVFYLGISMLELVNVHGENDAIRLYREMGRRVFLPLRVSDTILNYEKPDIVFATNSPRMERAFVQSAMDRYIKNFQINDLYSFEALNIVSNNIIVMNDFVKREIEYSRKANIFVLGQPALEESYNLVRKLNNAKVRRKALVSSDKIVLTFFTQQKLSKDENGKVLGVYSNQKLINLYLDLFRKLKRLDIYEICVRTHPNQDASEYKMLFDHSKHLNPILSSYESINVSDIIIIQDSTIGVEAIVSGKLVFTFGEKGELSPVWERAPFHYFSSIEDLYIGIIESASIEISDSCVADLPKSSARNIKKLLLDSL